MTAATLGRIIDDAIASLPGLPPKITITDGTASCGGNVMSFMCHSRYGHVNAVEVNAETFNLLRQNIQITKQLRPYSANVNTLFASYLDVMHTLEQDVVFLDPPWGGIGSNSKDGPLVDLQLGNKPLVEIVNDLYTNRHVKGTKYVVLKVCNRFNFEKFTDELLDGIILSTSVENRALSFPVLIYSFNNTNPLTNQLNQYTVNLKI